MKYVREMEGLRGVMALWVLLGHVASTVALNNALFRHRLANGLAVDVFIILSGFAIAAMVHKNPEDYRTYIVRRVLRIFPVYLLFLVLSIAAAPWALEVWKVAPAGSMRDARIQIASDSLQHWWPHVLAHVTALHGLVPSRLLPSTDFAFLGQAWSISLEWQFYLIAPALIRWLICGKTAAHIAWAILACAVLALGNHLMPYGFIGRYLPEFILGIATFHFMNARAIGNLLVARIPIGQAWMLVVSTCIMSGNHAVVPYVIWASTTAAVIAAREGSSLAATTLSRILCSSPLQALGKMAYSVYLSHMLIILLGLSAIERMNVQGAYTASALLVVFTVIGTLLVSVLSYRGVEKPFHELGRRLQAGTTGSAVADRAAL